MVQSHVGVFMRVDFFPTCTESFANNIDPAVHGILAYRDQWCPNGQFDSSLLRGVDVDGYTILSGWLANYHLHSSEHTLTRLDDCDLFHTRNRLASAAYILKVLSRNSNINSTFYKNWNSYTKRTVRESGGLYKTCRERGHGAVHQKTRIVLPEVYFWGMSLEYATMVLAHEGQHEYETHVFCDRADDLWGCDEGYEVYNPGPGFDDTNAYTISFWIYDDMLKSFMMDDNSNIKIVQDGNQCRYQYLLTAPLRNNTFSYRASDYEMFNIPVPAFRYESLADMNADINPPWNCTLNQICSPSDFTYTPGIRENLSCNETLNPDNAVINAFNASLCEENHPLIEGYRNLISEAQPEEVDGLRQQYTNHVFNSRRACEPITQENLDNYCDQRIGEVDNVYELDEYGYMTEYSNTGADYCAKKYCQQPEFLEIFHLLKTDPDYSERVLNREYSSHSSYYAIFDPKNSLCLQYFCGEDLDCLRRYVIYGGNPEIARGELNTCEGEYISCLDDNGMVYESDEYPNYLYPRENNEENNEFDENTFMSHHPDIREITSLSCQRAYNICLVRDSAQKGKILGHLYKEINKAYRYVGVANGTAKINPSDFITSRIRPSTKQKFTNELVYRLNQLEKGPTNFKVVKKFNSWFSQRENLSYFGHFNPQAFLAFFDLQDAALINGPWMNKRKALDLFELAKSDSELSSLLSEYTSMEKINNRYTGVYIQSVILNAAKTMPEKQYRYLLQNMLDAKNSDELIRAINAFSGK